MTIALLVILGLALLILGHEAGHFFVAKFFKMKVDEFGIGFPPRLFAKRKGETEYSVNLLPFGGFVKIAGENDRPGEALDGQDEGRLFFNQSVWKRALVTIAGVTVNFIIGWVLLTFVLMRGTPSAVVVTDVDTNSPAHSAGLEAGDIVRRYSSAGIQAEASTVQSFIDFINQNRGKEVSMVVVRDSGEVSLSAIPRVSTDEPGLGITLNEAGSPRMGFSEAIGEGLTRTISFSWLTIEAFYKLIANLFTKAALLEGVVGPIGIFSVAQQTGGIALIYLLQLIALISVNLAVINLMPFPALDGGRLVLLIIEKLKGSPIPRKIEGWINGLGFAFLILLILLITIRDVSRWF